MPARSGPGQSCRCQPWRPLDFFAPGSEVWPSTAMLIAAYPCWFHFCTHSLNAVPPPPCTHTAAGQPPAGGGPAVTHAVLVADDIVFAKLRPTKRAPWLFLRLADLVTAHLGEGRPEVTLLRRRDAR